MMIVHTPRPQPTLYRISAPVRDATARLDPKLQRLVLQHRHGHGKQAGVSTAANEVAVVARVTDVEEWEGLSEVRIGSTIGRGMEGTWVVTGRIPVSRIEAVRRQPFVRSLKAAQPLRTMLRATTEETEARRDLLPGTARGAGGAGVVIGIVDYGCDFAHDNFRTAQGATRLLCIWDQNGPLSFESPFGYGRVYRRPEIDQALQQADPYAALGYEPEPNETLPSPGTHGTHCMDIAAGNGRGTRTPGVAPEADLIFVDVSHADLPETGPEVVNSSFGDSVRLLEALKFIFSEAGDRPCVVNVSLGTNGGPHDGTTLVEQGIDYLVSERPNRMVVVAAGNAFAHRTHTMGRVEAGGAAELRWRIPFNHQIPDELELWYDGEDRFVVELLDPDGAQVLSVWPGETDGLRTESGEVVVLVANRLNDPNNGDNVIDVYLGPGVAGGDWVVRVRGLVVSNGAFHAWIERDDLDPSSFASAGPEGEAADAGFTLATISCSRNSLVVGSYDAHKPRRPLSHFSSAGPTRDGRRKPELSAPGHAVLAACSRTRTALTLKEGTSMAAPAVTGAVALILAEARQRGLELPVETIRKLVLDAARRTPPPGVEWHPQYGLGRLSASAAVRSVIGMVAVEAGVAAVEAAAAVEVGGEAETSGVGVG